MNTTYVITFCIIAVAAAIIYVVGKFYKKDFLTWLVQCKPIIAALGGVVEALSAQMPSEQMNRILVVIKAATDGAQTAEKLWLMGQLPREERNARAKEIAKEAIEQAGFEVTDQIQMIISGVIEIVCILLPHGVEPAEAK